MFRGDHATQYWTAAAGRVLAFNDFFQVSVPPPLLSWTLIFLDRQSVCEIEWSTLYKMDLTPLFNGKREGNFH